MIYKTLHNKLKIEQHITLKTGELEERGGDQRQQNRGIGGSGGDQRQQNRGIGGRGGDQRQQNRFVRKVIAL